jgi:hypothetical protein
MGRKGQDRGDDRYDLSRASDFGKTPDKAASGKIEPGRVAVRDPEPHLEIPRRVIATVNRRVDILEVERSHDRISARAYRAGRLAQAVFERAGLGGSGAWREGSRVDAELAKELKIVANIDRARLIKGYVARLRKCLGHLDAEILRQVLGDNRRYPEVALPKGRLVDGRYVPRYALQKGAGDKDLVKTMRSERNATYIARRFRDALETLSDMPTQLRDDD